MGIGFAIPSNKAQNIVDQLKKNGKIFVDRNPLAFNMMVDFIRNNGELHEI